MRRTPLIIAAASLALATSTLAGSFTSDFSNPSQLGFTLNGGTRPDGFTPYPAIEEGHLALTYNENSQQAAIVIDDLDGFQPIEAFTVKFKLQIGPGSGNPADGVAFCFASEVNSGSNFGEEGTGTGVTVSFDTYDNGASEAPAVDVKFGGATLVSQKYVKADMVTGKFEDIYIQLSRAGTLSVGYKGQVICTNLILPDFTPFAGQFALGARTGGENAHQWIDDLDIKTTVVGNPVAPTLTAQPQSQTVLEGAPVTFSVGFDGSAPLTFQWLSNNVAIAEATSPSYTISRVPASAHGARYKCTVSNSAGSVTSAEATLTVSSDVTPPTLVTARGSVTFDAVTVTFSEPVNPATAQQVSNYQISGGVTIAAAAPQAAPNDHVVVLTTSKQPEGATLTLTVNNVKDAPGNTIAPNSQTPLLTYVYMAGAILHKKYNNVSDAVGGNPDNLFADPRFPNAPDRMDIMYTWEYPANGNTRVAADPVRNYFDTLEGFFIPPTSGNYVFLTAGADRWWLYLSTDDNPANRQMIAAEPGGWSDPRGWTQMYSGSLENRRSDLSALNVYPGAPVLNLTAGKRYYLLEVHHDPSWCGADDFSATFIKEGETDPANGSAPTLTGSVVGTYVDPTGASIEITQQPASATGEEQRTVTFTVVATGTSPYAGGLSYQWQRLAPGGGTWADIPGATAASYITPILQLADNGTKYRVVCTVPALSVTSDEATLLVVADTFPPKLVAAGSILRGTAIELGVGFDETVDETTASAVANYSLSKGSITGIRYQKYAHDGEAGKFQLGTAGPFRGYAVVLTTSGLAAGDSVTVTAKNIKDVKGNALSATGESQTLTVTRKMKWVAMGGDDFLQGELGGQNITPDAALWVDDVVAYSESDFDLISSGTANWNNYDEATFVYEEITGDFDKVVRVEYHDPTSQWARAGLCATPDANAGMTRAEVNGGALMSKRFLQRANPQVQWSGAAGNWAYEYAYRRMDGGNYSGGGAGNPAFPTAWMRMKRAGQVFTAYYSNNGTDWTQYGTFTFTDSPGSSELMPNTLLVGIYYCPEFLNNATGEGVGHSTVGKFRRYGDLPKEVGPLSIALSGSTISIGWPAGSTLESAPSVTGPWTTVSSPPNPYTVPLPGPGAATYYRAKQ